MEVFVRLTSQPLRCYSQKAVVKTLPRPKGLPFIGTTWDLISAGGGPKLHLYIDARHKQLGPIFHETLGPVSAVFISDPKDMRRVFSAEGKYPVHLLPDAWVLYNKLYNSERGLFFMKGEDWLQHRHIMNKIMLKTESSEGVVNTYNKTSQDLVDEWSQNMDGSVNNVVNHMYKLSISYVLASMMGSSYPQHKQQLTDDVEQLSSVVYLIFEESTRLNLLPAKMAASLRLPVWRRFVTAVDTTLKIANKLVSQCLPLAASDGMLYQMSTEGIAHDKLVSIVVDLILAGADTTPYTLIWALYLLARNPDVQGRVAREVCHCPSDQWLSHPLLRAVLRETLRLYPAAPFLTRSLASEVQLSGYTLPAEEMIIMSQYTSGRSDSYFPEAHKFWPERWLRDEDQGGYRGVTDTMASLPFAMGGRSCIGRKVAEAMFSLTLAKILSKMHLEVKKEIEMILMLVPVPAEPVHFYLSRREK